MPKPKPTLAELVQVLDDGTTLADILIGFGYYKKEKERCRLKDQVQYQRRKVAKKASERPPIVPNSPANETG